MHWPTHTPEASDHRVRGESDSDRRADQASLYGASVAARVLRGVAGLRGDPFGVLLGSGSAGLKLGVRADHVARVVAVVAGRRCPLAVRRLGAASGRADAFAADTHPPAARSGPPALGLESTSSVGCSLPVPSSGLLMLAPPSRARSAPSVLAPSSVTSGSVISSGTSTFDAVFPDAAKVGHERVRLVLGVLDGVHTAGRRARPARSPGWVARPGRSPSLSSPSIAPSGRRASRQKPNVV